MNARSLLADAEARLAEAGEVLLRGAVPLTDGHGCQLAAGRLACSGGGTLTVTDVG